MSYKFIEFIKCKQAQYPLQPRRVTMESMALAGIVIYILIMVEILGGIVNLELGSLNVESSLQLVEGE